MQRMIGGAYKTRALRTMLITDSHVSLEMAVMSQPELIRKDKIVSVKVMHTIFDIPFLEKTIVLFLNDGRKIKFPCVKKADVCALVNKITDEQRHPNCRSVVV